MGWEDKHKMCVGEYLTGGSHVLFLGSAMVFAHLTPRKPKKSVLSCCHYMSQFSWSCDKGTHTRIPVVILLIKFLVATFSYNMLLGVLCTHCLRNLH
jgi:hypothetical protein